MGENDALSGGGEQAVSAEFAGPTTELGRQLASLLGQGKVSDADDVRETHAMDKWYAKAQPAVVVFAESTQDVSKLLDFAHRNRIPVTTRGAGYGYVGGCVPVLGGVALSMARMNRILEINTADGVAVVEPGVITAELQGAVRECGWDYPPDPASLKECSIGGNIATNAGGPRCLKYGVTRNYVLGLEVVLANGQVLECGGRVHKNKTGFDLVSLFTGSEGMLGVVTRATLRPSTALRFWGRVPGISQAIGADESVIFKIGIGEVPLLHQVTFSIWPSERAMAGFARTGPHAEAIRAVREQGWFKEELYARFSVLSDLGTWNGQSPLQNTEAA